MTTRLTRIAALIMAVALLVTGCSQSTGDTEATPTVEATTPALEATESAVEETPEAAPVPTEVGATVRADQVDAAREAGAAVYVSPNGEGEGIVVEPGITPDVIVEDVEVANSITVRTMDDFGEVLSQEGAIAREAIAANTGVFIPTIAPSFAADGSIESTQYVVGSLGDVEGHERGVDVRRPTREAAVEAVQHLIDQNPGLRLVDLT